MARTRYATTRRVLSGVGTRKHHATSLGALVCAVLGSVFIGVVAALHPQTAFALAGVGLGLGAFTLALVRPDLVFMLGILVLAWVPMYWVPSVRHVLLLPGVILLSLSVIGSAKRAGGRRAGDVTWRGVDIALAVMLGLMLVSTVLGVRRPGDIAGTVFVHWLIPYLAARYTVSRHVSPTTFAACVVVAGVVLVPFAALELATGGNLFAGIILNQTQGDNWAGEITRLGAPRAEASFGHPIALSVFLASGVVFAVALAVRASAKGRTDWVFVWAGSAMLLGGGILATVSRTGWILVLAAATLALWHVASTRLSFAVRRSAINALAVTTGGLIAALVVSRTASALLGLLFGNGGTESAQTAQYRVNLLQSAGRQHWSWFGNNLTAFVDTGMSSIDNAYLWFADRWGVAGLVGLVGIVGLLAASVLSRRTGGFAEVIKINALATFVALLFVAPITQSQDFVFLFLGAAAACGGRVPQRNTSH